MTAHVDNRDVWTWPTADWSSAGKVVVDCLRTILSSGLFDRYTLVGSVVRRFLMIGIIICQIIAKYEGLALMLVF